MPKQQSNLSPKILSVLKQAQKNEITEYLVYKKLSQISKDSNNNKILNKISQDEIKHYNFF